MVELDKYLRKKKPIEPADLRMTGLGLHLLGKLGQYISLMYGVYHIIQENPDIKRVLLGGAVYGGFSVAEYTGTLLASRAEGEIIRREQEDIRGRLELFEKKVSGRAIGAGF